MVAARQRSVDELQHSLQHQASQAHVLQEQLSAAQAEAAEARDVAQSTAHAASELQHRMAEQEVAHKAATEHAQVRRQQWMPCLCVGSEALMQRTWTHVTSHMLL